MSQSKEPRWFHCTTHTYGAWLPGDPRGFRTRHHREHVEGDYKNPPPKGLYEDRLRRSRELMTQDPVEFPVDWRAIIGRAVKDRLIEFGVQLLCLSCGTTHVHALFKSTPDLPRYIMGIAKKHAWHSAIDRGWRGKLWAKRSKATPIRDRAHQLNAFNYILRHVDEGAWVWDFRQDGKDKSPPVATGGL